MLETMNEEEITEKEHSTPVAAEYVLGVLSAQERRDFEARLLREPALAADVEFWEGKLGGLASEVTPVSPPDRIWSRIATTLPAKDAARSVDLWQNLAFWRWVTAGSVAIAAASLAGLIYVGHPPSPSQPLVAKLDVSGGQVGFVAAIDREGGGLTIVPASATDVQQRVLELWLIAPGDQPRSLGLIEPGRPVHINLSAALIPRVAPDATLAVSLEPPGGSPSGLPTGPVIASGKLTSL
jgi:anti-sigma-K factor RskA